MPKRDMRLMDSIKNAPDLATDNNPLYSSFNHRGIFEPPSLAKIDNLKVPTVTTVQEDPAANILGKNAEVNTSMPVFRTTALRSQIY